MEPLEESAPSVPAEDWRSDGPHDEIVRLEGRIDDVAARIESCRKFILAARIAVTGGGGVLAAMVAGAIPFHPGIMAAAVAAFLGGITVWGSNTSTAKEAAKELAMLEAHRSALIEKMMLRIVQ